MTRENAVDKGKSGLLIAIGIFRLAKAILLVAAGLATLKLLHPGVGGALLQRVHDLPLMPGHDHLMNATARLARLPPRRLEELAVGLFAYAALFVIEGAGLILRKVWAEYLSIVATASFIPFEVHELLKRMTPMRVAILVVNIAIVIYLVWRRIEARRRPRNGSAKKPVNPS